MYHEKIKAIMHCKISIQLYIGSKIMWQILMVIPIELHYMEQVPERSWRVWWWCLKLSMVRFSIVNEEYEKLIWVTSRNLKKEKADPEFSPLYWKQIFSTINFFRRYRNNKTSKSTCTSSNSKWTNIFITSNDIYITRNLLLSIKDSFSSILFNTTLSS